MPFMPAFLRHYTEAQIIGRILAGYGEIEYALALCVGSALNDEHTALRTLFKMKGERISVADSLLRPACDKAGIAGSYTAAIGAIRCCAKIRNHYAHCNWDDHKSEGLFFVDLQETARSPTKLEYRWLHVDVPLLKEQETFFFYTLELLQFIKQELDFKSGKSRTRSFSEPPKRLLPNLHNPEGQHPPPWTTSDMTNPE
jgi:hypothetical protein